MMSEFSDWLQNNWIDLARLGVQTAILLAIVRYGRRVLAAVRASQEQIGALLKLSVADGVSEKREQLGETEPVVAREPFAEPGVRREAEFLDESGPRVAIKEPAFEPPMEREPARQPIWQAEREAEPVLAQASFVGPASMRNEYARSEYGERGQSLGGRVVGGISSTGVLDPPFAEIEPMARVDQPVPRSEVRPFTPWVSAPTVGPEARSDFPASAASPVRVGVQSWLNAPIKRNSGPGAVKKMVRWLKAPVRTPHPRPVR
jgi:hypothetical protein